MTGGKAKLSHIITSRLSSSCVYWNYWVTTYKPKHLKGSLVYYCSLLHKGDGRTILCGFSIQFSIHSLLFSISSVPGLVSPLVVSLHPSLPCGLSISSGFSVILLFGCFVFQPLSSSHSSYSVYHLCSLFLLISECSCSCRLAGVAASIVVLLMLYLS